MTPYNILIVDDEVQVRKVLSQLFQQKQYSVSIATTGREALEVITQTKCDAAIIDIDLPDMKGLAVLEKFKETYAEMICVMISGHASVQYAIEAMELGADRFYVKPFPLEQIFIHVDSKIKEHLDRKKTLQLNELSRTIIDNIHEAVSIVDTGNFEIQMSNQVVSERLGLTEGEILGKTCHKLIFNLDSPCRATGTECPLEETLRTGKHARREMQHIFQDNTVSYVEISTSPIKDGNGKIIQVVHVIRDITESRTLAMSLADEKNNLEKINSELKTALKELKSTQARVIQQEKMASIGQLAAGVAHEINNPVGFISSNLGTLAKYGDKLNEFIKIQDEALSFLTDSATIAALEEQRKKLKVDYLLADIKDLISESLEGAERVKTIVQNLKSFARVEENKPILTDINTCLTSTLNIVWNELKYKAKVSQEFGDLPQVRCFPQQINQVFMNVLINAAHAIESQGEITIRSECDNGRVIVSISDSGCGIPEQNRSKIFEPFFTTKEAGKGTGLGLSIAYDIIKKHQGEITFDSEVGKGTTFKVILPAA